MKNNKWVMQKKKNEKTLPKKGSCEWSVLQALFEEARSSCVRSKANIHTSKLDFPLDRSAVATARELSKKLDEAPQEGGCPFMTSAKTQLAEPAPAKPQHDTCPLSSSHAAQSQSQAAQTDVTRSVKQRWILQIANRSVQLLLLLLMLMPRWAAGALLASMVSHHHLSHQPWLHPQLLQAVPSVLATKRTSHLRFSLWGPSQLLHQMKLRQQLMSQ